MSLRDAVYILSTGSTAHLGHNTFQHSFWSKLLIWGSFFLAMGDSAGCLPISMPLPFLFAKRILILFWEMSCSGKSLALCPEQDWGSCGNPLPRPPTGWGAVCAWVWAWSCGKISAGGLGKSLISFKKSPLLPVEVVRSECDVLNYQLMVQSRKSHIGGAEQNHSKIWVPECAWLRACIMPGILVTWDHNNLPYSLSCASRSSLPHIQPKETNTTLYFFE